MDVHSMNTLVVGSGTAGFHAAERLHALGQTDIALLTEGIGMGTSRNAGSDKQTYYKLTLAGSEPDSVGEMAKTLFEGGAAHGDIALVQAALSARCFLHLADIGVPFPQNRFGEYVGYRTDHDARLRAASAGPLTSRLMTECLERQVKQKGIRIFDRFLAIGILTASTGGEGKDEADLQSFNPDADELFHEVAAHCGDNARRRSAGLIALDLDCLDSPSHGVTLFNCTNLVYATGGPAGIYSHSVYPESQTGAMGIALEAGAPAANLTESQFGIASVKFRWNLSGTYQQVLPRYLSTDSEGKNPREFLLDWFHDAGSMMDAIFRKGYQWPFDPAKAMAGGSSIIDLLVGLETARGRRVFLDFTRNPGTASGNGTVDLSESTPSTVRDDLDFSLLGPEAHGYLERSGALFGKPIDRLRHMNAPAVDLYGSHGICLDAEWLEIAVCAQHANGGLVGNTWWESSLRHFFPIGEVNGSFGIHRPGGSALNAAQVGGLRAAEYIAARCGESPMMTDAFLLAVEKQVSMKTALVESLLHQTGPARMKVPAESAEPARLRVLAESAGPDRMKVPAESAEPAQARLHAYSPVARQWSVRELREMAGARMSAAGAYLRPVTELEAAAGEALQWVLDFPSNVRLDSVDELPDAFRLRDILLTRYAFLSAICGYVKYGGGSRGSSLVVERGFETGNTASDDCPALPGGLSARPENPALRDKVCEVKLFPRASETGEIFDLSCEMQWKNVRPVPSREDWFETTWRDYRNGSHYI